MLVITVGDIELFDDARQEFIIEPGFRLELEHSLVALSKWESKYEKAFLSQDEKTTEEVLGYVQAMTLTPEVPPEIFSQLSQKNNEEITAYINARMTATTFGEMLNQPRSREIITSELIYYWIASANIPLACENWHLNRLFTLIKVVGVKNSKPKKMSQAELAARNRALNEERKKANNTSG